MAGLRFRIFCTSCLVFSTIFIIVYCAESDIEVPAQPKLPSGDLNHEPDFRDFLVVSTLDGRVTALDPRNGGQTVWSLKTEPGDLLSSSLRNLEIPTRGQWMQLVPSLDGQLYKFDGETIEPIPASVDTLLKSSYKVADNLIIVGGKETRSYGVNLRTGELKYTCSMEGCNKFGEISNAEDILVIERHSQTVRAIHTRTGTDQWNFSVGEHRVTVARGFQDSFSDETIEEENVVNSEDILLTCDEDDCDDKSKASALKVIIPDGLVAAYDPSKHLMWSQKFSSPIENVWKLKEEKVWALNLFDHETFLSYDDHNNLLLPPPLLVLGLYDKKLYVKHSPKLKNQVTGTTKNFVISSSSKEVMPRISWKPYIATAPSRTPFLDNERGEISTALALQEDFDYPFDRGFYLYDSAKALIDNSSLCLANGSHRGNQNEEEEEETLEQIIIVSLWHWWKEVIAISLVSSVLINILVYRCIFKKIHPTLSPESSCSEIQIVNPFVQPSNHEGLSTKKQDEKEEIQIKPPEYVSRYLTDFEPLQCLGKGGFGVVFEARNKIDDCSYAVKRIGLNNRDDAFEKVMREVKALAKLDHSGIVRYFNAWFETPPRGWQEMKDKEWDECSKASASFGLSSPFSTGRHSMITPKFRNPFKPFDTSENDGLELVNKSMDDGSSFGFEFAPREPDNANSVASDSFEVVFDQAGASCGDYPNSSGTLLVSKSNKPGKNTSNEKRNSFLISSDDSRCADQSHSTEEEELGKSSSLEEILCDVGEKASARPSALSVTESSAHKINNSTIYLYIQMQLCRKESLKDWLNFNTENRDRVEVLDIFDQIVNAVHYVHECGLMHRDLKPSNIFFSMDGTIKVGDFGLVTAVAEAHTPADCDLESSFKSLVKHTDQVGTQLYMSPEQISRLPYNRKVDIFSLGLIFFELLVPFTTQSERIKVLLDARKQKFPDDFRKHCVEECEFVSKLLSHKPAERPSAAEIKQHSLFIMFQPEPVVIGRAKRRRTLSRRLSSSGSDCDTNPPDGNKNTLNV